MADTKENVKSVIEVKDRMILVTTSFIGFHYWDSAPDEIGFLRNIHRHKFNVYVKIPVRHNERDLEFTLVKRFVDAWIEGHYIDKGAFPDSCETIAEKIGRAVLDKYEAALGCIVTVDEDGENGAILVLKRTVVPKATEYVLDPVFAQIARDLWKTIQTWSDVIPKVKDHTPPPTKRDKPFIGIEAEGPLRGMPTLFLPASARMQSEAYCFRAILVVQTLVELASHANPMRHKNKWQVYLGAGDYPLSLSTQIDILHNFKGLINRITSGPLAYNPVITFEVQGMRGLPRLRELIVSLRKDNQPHYRKGRFNVVTLDRKDFDLKGLEECNFLKVIEDGQITWHSRNYPKHWSVSVKQPEFKFDTFIEDISHANKETQVLLVKFEEFFRSEFDCYTAVE